MPKLKSLTPSQSKTKKYKAVFETKDGKTKTVQFGAKGYSDYTKNKDDSRKKKYIQRHKKNENWSDPMTAGTLSRYILWNKKTIKASVADYKRRFNL